MLRLLFPALTLLILATSCTTLQTSSLKEPRVVHVVVCWLKNPKDTGDRQELIKTSKSFREIPGVLEVRAGEVLVGDRPAVDASFDVAVMIYFRNEEALRVYEQHPLHQLAVKEKLLPQVRKFVVYDFLEK